MLDPTRIRALLNLEQAYLKQQEQEAIAPPLVEVNKSRAIL